MAVLTNTDLMYEAITAVYIASCVHANRWRGGSLRGETALNGPRELCAPQQRAGRGPAPRYRPWVRVPCAGAEHRSLWLTERRSPPACRGPVPAVRAGWGIRNARAGAAAAAAVMK